MASEKNSDSVDSIPQSGNKESKNASSEKNKLEINKVKQFIYQEFIYGGHIPAFVAVGIVLASAVLLNILVTPVFLVVVYLIFYCVYLYNYFKEFEKDFLTNSDRAKHIKINIKYYPTVLFCAVIAIIFILLKFGNILSFIFGLGILVVGFFYTSHLKKFTAKVIGFKSFYVSFVCASLVLFTSFYDDAIIDLTLFLVFSFVFLRMFLNTIFFDIKDIESDSKEGLKTFPIILGKKKTLIFLHIINIISFTPLLLGIYQSRIPFFSFSFFIFFFYGLCYLLAVNNNNDTQKKYYMMADGEFVFWPIVLFISKFISTIW